MMGVASLAPCGPAALLGRRIAGYVIDEVIGAGGMGAIYGATSRFVKKRAAVKVMLHELTEDREVVGRFLQEAFVASAVDHPNVVEIWAADRFEEDGRMYILMPLIEGASLEVLCEQAGRLGIEAAAAIAIQIAAGLAAVHELGVVHRDIKPANILITKKQGLRHFVKIVDFGVARLLAPQLVGASSDRRTRTNMVVGTAGSMAPEQAAGSRDVDARADIYSWGVVLYRMLTGRPPYQGASVWDLLEQARRGESFPRPRALRPDLPRAWEDVIMASLELYPHRRPSSMKEVVRSIAAPLPSGAAMLATLAPDLARDRRLGAAEKTLTGELAECWAVAPGMERTRRRRAAVIGAATAAAVAGIGVIGGVIGARMAARSAPISAQSAATVVESVSEPIPSTPVSAPPVAPAPMAAPAPAPGPTPIPVLAPVEPPPPTGAGSKAAPFTVDSVARPAAGPVIQTGLIIVRSSPWARVWIDDEALGQTAVRKTVKAGAHRIRLVGPDDKTKELIRTIKAGETMPIRWDW